MLEDLDLDSIADERARALVGRLLNLLEDVMADLRAAQAENQHLRDEINRLKGEQGRPTDSANLPLLPRMVKILELAFQRKITSLSLLPLRLVFRPTITSYSASLWMVKAEGRGDGLETTPGIYHGDRRSRTAVAQ